MLIQRLSLLMALMCSRPKSGHSTLIIFPRDTEVLVNHSTYFMCSTSILSEQIHWYHKHVGENQTIYVYYKGQFNQIYADRFSIEINVKTGEYNLIIRSVQPGDAGRYVCQDDGGLGNSRSAELIVLESTPTCLFSMKPDGFVGPNSCNLPLEILQLSCSVSYIGNIPPILQWKMSGNDDPILEGIAIDYSGKRATLNLMMNSTVEINGESFTCGTTRSHDKQLSCTTDPAKINYAVGQSTIMNIAKGETITCSVNASVPCTYRWLYENNTQYPVSNNQVLTTDRLGNHSCEASCPINGISCTFVAIRIIVFEEITSTASEDNTTTLLMAILIPTVVILLIIACVGLGLLFFRKRKARIENRAHKSKGTELSAVGEDAPLNDDGAEKVASIAGDNNRTIIKEEENTTKASLEMGSDIAGIAALDDMIYVVSDRSSEVEMYDIRADEFIYRRSVNLVELKNPWDMTSCRLKKCLFIMDRRSPTTPNRVIRVDSNVANLVPWSTEDVYGKLSVTSEGNVVITFCEGRRLIIYGPDGARINDLSLPKKIIHPSHALKLTNGQFLICHGINEDNMHRVCILNKNGKLIKNSSTSMGAPSYLAVDDAGWVFVVHQRNSRVCVLSSDLKELASEVFSEIKELGLLCPQRICLNVKTGKVLVVNNNASDIRRQNGKLSIEIYDSGRFLTRSLHTMCSCRPK